MVAESAGRGRSLILVRHGRTAWNDEGRAQGQSDVTLDDTGRHQAERMATVVAEVEPALLMSSDLSRARETAAFLEKATGLTAVEDPRLREHELGERTGLTMAEFGERMGTEFDGWWDVHAHVDVPGAESEVQVAERIVPALLDVLERLGPDECAVVVTHGAALRIGLAGVLGWPLETAGGMEAMDNCAWAVLAETGQGRLRLSAYNRSVRDTPDSPSGSAVG